MFPYQYRARRNRRPRGSLNVLHALSLVLIAYARPAGLPKGKTGSGVRPESRPPGVRALRLT